MGRTGKPTSRRSAEPTARELVARGRGARITQRLLDWYATHHRELPWRRTRDPYAIWVSETMLQQTQVATVVPYFERWMRRFPTVRSLARADEDDVLHAWQGLGYYRRARSLHRAARQVVRDHGARLPHTARDLETLPGIGRYSAGAIASIAYEERAAVVDGNVVRVLCRVFGLGGDPTRAPLSGLLWDLAGELVPDRAPGDFNQALMELGATVCTPRSPACGACPLTRSCRARRDGAVATLPELPVRRSTLTVRSAAAVAERRGCFLVTRVPDDAARWRGMWRFPTTDVRDDESAEHAAARALREATSLRGADARRIMVIKFRVTHHAIKLDTFHFPHASGRARAVSCAAVAWKHPEELAELAMPSADRRVARALVDD